MRACARVCVPRQVVKEDVCTDAAAQHLAISTAETYAALLVAAYRAEPFYDASVRACLPGHFWGVSHRCLLSQCTYVFPTDCTYPGACCKLLPTQYQAKVTTCLRLP